MSKSKRAFTLIELLVVIAIIAILAAILFPVFAQAKLAAKKAVDLSNLKQMDLAVDMYTNDYDDEWPTLADFDQCGINQYHTSLYGTMSRWSSMEEVGAYIKNTQMMLAPIDSPYTVLDTGSYYGYIAPIPNTRIPAPISYMANGFSNRLINGTHAGGTSPYFAPNVFDYTGPFDPGDYYGGSCTTGTLVTYTTAQSTTSATNPANLILLTGGQVGFATAWYTTPGYNNTETFSGSTADLKWGWDAIDLAEGYWEGTSAPDPNMTKAWHSFNGGSNFAFADGHAKSTPCGSLVTNVIFSGNTFVSAWLNPNYWIIDPPAQ